jgi:DMATS type aromatic prenyltransferase
MKSESSDAAFWWRTAGRALACLIAHTEYPVKAQHRHLLFFRDFIAPQLGLAPAEREQRSLPWQSFMTDDGTPLELSWDWGVTGDAPKVRFSIEPIATHAGTPVDPLNRHAGYDLVRRLQAAVPTVNLELFDHFAAEFMVFDKPHAEGHQSRFFAAFDLEPSGEVVTKAYFFPAFKGLSKDPVARLQGLGESLKRMPAHFNTDYDGLDVLRTYMARPAGDAAMQFEILAIDCIEPSKSRLKIYTRCQHTHFNSVRTAMTLGGMLDSPDLLSGLVELRELWSLLFGERPDSEELRSVHHRTAGLLYNFEIPPNGGRPVPKIYIPVRHYAASDTAVVDALQVFLRRRRGNAYFDVQRYRQALSDILYADFAIYDLSSH